jgi:hypothetical protein
MLVPVRRIITGHDDEGRSIVLRDDISPHRKENPVQPSRGLTDIWRTFELLPDNIGDEDAAETEVVLNPPSNGTVFRFFQIPPEAQSAAKSWEERQAQANAVFQGMGAGHNRDSEARHPGMHKTDTVDYIILLSGVVTLLLDEGEVDMKPMDVVVQRGTNHAWANRGTEPAVLAGVLMDAVPG